jgi:hypothetical protein
MTVQCHTPKPLLIGHLIITLQPVIFISFSLTAVKPLDSHTTATSKTQATLWQHWQSPGSYAHLYNIHIILIWKYLFLLQIVPSGTQHHITSSTGRHDSTPLHTLRPIIVLSCAISKFLFETLLWVFRAIFFICTSTDFMWMLLHSCSSSHCCARSSCYYVLNEYFAMTWIYFVWFEVSSVLDDICGLQEHNIVLTANLLLTLWMDLLPPSSRVIQE